MRHDWIFDVLRDLKAYAVANSLPALASKADEAMRVARAEVSVAAKGENPADLGADPEGGIPPLGRAH